ncbi:methyltransferase domain-containing protein [Planctomycetota bacterium]|nr:methyltransferase domain-containing protein [Planctomycetota bacterium]
MSPAAPTTEQTDATREHLREYYGRTLKTNDDLAEQACCTVDTMARFKDTIKLIPDEVVTKHYGCGCPLPEDSLKGLTCLDLGSGAGLDVFLLSKLVGPTGHVHGVDMTDEQLDTARRNAPVVAKAFGYDETNTTFHKGFIETCDAIPDNSIDLVISDCVLNLSPRKDLVYATIWRVLKEGGELYVSDISSDRRVPPVIADDEVMVAECLGGAQYEHDWFDTMKDAGFRDPRVVDRKVLQTDVKGEAIEFSSLTVRAQKFAEPLDRRCEDYGQFATYLGGLCRCPARFMLDADHVFEKDRPVPVCRNTARMLSDTRLGKHFRVTEPVKHFGLFGTGPHVALTGASSASMPAAGACC